MEPAASLVSFRTSSAALTPLYHSHSFAWQPVTPAKSRTQPLRASGMAGSKAGAKLVSAGCKTCRGKGAIECPGCQGTGKNKKNGNIFERWKCFDCQGFGLKSCPSCGMGGLTPEQRGERNNKHGWHAD